MIPPKTKKELELAGTYRADRHKYLDNKIKGNIVTEVLPSRGWRKAVKEQFEFVTENLIKYEMLQTQDIPGLYQIGDYLQELDYTNRELKNAKKEDDIDKIIKLQNQKIKLTKAYTELAQKYFITPSARHKAIAMMGQNNQPAKPTDAEDLIQNGSL